MRRFFEILFVIAIIVVGYYTFRPQPAFPYNASNGYLSVQSVANQVSSAP
ncbi:hypothetical protein ACOJUR_05865 [Alicyclobacillus tolerans]|uniref:Uncharacterized protein n=2 Tax=Alicyclobacillus tolerans TaxID=90970 RepID=A0A1M6L5F4_9BACL|nr:MULTISPECIES: hypothetical protein [Alicyclobacillus]MDP9727568.1 hypothetical protein [Alicyclobacillus tengchongensis]SHJ66433.1 hypothetical protein SAMN05443507_102105 [Alicyclobacillus montanus]